MPPDGASLRARHRNQGRDDAQVVGETYAQIKAEAANPRGDVWWGGTGDPHLQAAEENLTEPYKSAKLGELLPWAVKQAEQSGFKTVGIYAGALGFSFNKEQIARKKLPEPKCWADLASRNTRMRFRLPTPTPLARPTPRSRR